MSTILTIEQMLETETGQQELANILWESFQNMKANPNFYGQEQIDIPLIKEDEVGEDDGGHYGAANYFTLEDAVDDAIDSGASDYCYIVEMHDGTYMLYFESAYDPKEAAKHAKRQ